MKVGCTIYWDDDKYIKIAKNAINSFKHFHPEIPVYVVNNKTNYDSQKVDIKSNIKKYMCAYEIFTKEKLDKIIALGADTITCDRLNEFLEGGEDVLAGLDYPYRLITEYFSTPDSETHINSDVVCFNNPKMLYDVIKCSRKHKEYFDQGGLNEVIWSGKYSYSYKIVDSPYETTSVLYNVRSKGNICAGENSLPWAPYTTKFYVKDNKLYTHNHKQIKVWHYCQGFGHLSANEISEQVNRWTNSFFNEETVNFFRSIRCEL